MKNDDTKLIQRVLAGDDNAFSVLVRKYQKQVHALAWRKIGDFHIAEEITQDTFLKAYKRLPTLKKPQRFVSWLYVIAANRCSSWLRKKRLWTQPLEELEETDDDPLQKATYSGYVIEENERTAVDAQREVVKKLLAKLQESERTVITLHYFGEMSCTEIGAFLGVSANTIKSRLRRAQQRLRKEEPMIRDALENFKITPNFTENIMLEIARIKPVAPSSGKPLIPWAIATSTIAVVLLMLGIGNHQYLGRFQKPYNFDATSEMTIELIEAPLVLNLVSKTDKRTQLGNPNASNKSNIPDRKRNNIPALYAEAQTDKTAEDYAKWELPTEAKARLGKGGINVIQFSPDGVQLAVGSNIGIWLYDVETGKELSLFAGMCQSLAFSPDGQFIASGGGRFRGQELKLWEIATNQKVLLSGGPFVGSVLRFSADGKTLISLGSWGELITQLDVETGAGHVKKIDGRSWERINRRSSPEPYALTHDKFAVGDENGKIELWDTMTGAKLSTLGGHREPPVDRNNHVLVLEFSPDGRLLASGSKDKTVRLWDTTTGTELAVLRKHTGWINALAFSPDGRTLATGSTDKTARLWNTAKGELLATLTGPLNGIVALSFSPDGTMLASGSTDGTVRFWSTKTRNWLPLDIIEHTEWVRSVSFLKDNTTLVSVDFNRVITLWDLQTSQKIGLQTTQPTESLWAVALSPDGTKLASIGAKAVLFFEAGSGNSTATWTPERLVRLTDVRTGRELATLTETVDEINPGRCMTFSPDGKIIAFGGSDKIHLWNIETGSSLDISLVEEQAADGNGHFFSPPVDINAFVFSPDGKKLVSGTMGGKVQMWDTETGVPLAPFFEGQNMEEAVEGGPGNFRVTYRDAITALAFSSNGRLLAVGSDQKIRLLGSREYPPLKDTPRGTQALAFSSDDTVLVTGMREGSVELWNLATGDKLKTLKGHTAIVEAVVFSPDGKKLVSTGKDGTILLWDWEEIINR